MRQDDQQSAERVARPRLLVVDDLEDNRILILRRFQRRGFEVVEAVSGAVALDYLARETFDLVLLDIMMPDMDGFEVLSRIRESHSPAELPVIMVTLKNTSADIIKALKLGANDYITKPVDFDVAHARVEAHVARKQAEARARQSQPDLEKLVDELKAAVRQADAATRAKSDFLANMSHEIRTPLNGILGMASVLAEAGPDDAQRKMARTIVESAVGLERLLSDALDLSRVEAGKLEIRHETFDLTAVVQRSAELFRSTALGKGLSFEVDVDAVAGGVIGDALRLQQILTNLISNAVKFTAIGSVRCQVRRMGAECHFEIRDTGIGFEAARAGHLFNRFQQADDSIARDFGGSGLGLAISKHLAELMGGTLTAASEPGQGSVFSLILPLPRIDGATDSPTLTLSGAATGPRARVLVADDHATNRHLMEVILTQLGVELVMVSDGAQALDAMAAERFDAVLMDVQMPVLDGLSAIRIIRRREAEQGLSRTPILTLSAHAMDEHVQMSLSAGADDHLTKPIQARRLAEALRRHLSGEPAPAKPARLRKQGSTVG